MPFLGSYNGCVHEPALIPDGACLCHRRPEWRRKNPGRSQIRRHGFGGLPLESGGRLAAHARNYYGLVTLVDEAVGRILAALESSGQVDETIVVFTSDHGEMMGDHACLTKNLTYEQSIRIPLLVRTPSQSGQPNSIPGYVSQIDLVPNLIDLLGEKVPAHLQGRSLARCDGRKGGSLEQQCLSSNGTTA